MRPIVSSLLCLLLIAGCSGMEVIPADTERFVSTQYVRYAWRSEPLTQDGSGKDKLTQADPAIRSAIAERLSELGYREVAKDEAQFMVEYLAAAGINDGLLSSSGTNVTRATLGTINRLPDGATVDNAYALSGVVPTGNLLLVFVESDGLDVLWQVSISVLIEDANRVNERAVRSAIRKGLSTLPRAPGV